MRFSMLLAALALTGTASAQSTIYGVNLRLAQSYTSTADANFVTNNVVLGPKATPLYAVDFNADATALWAIDNGTQMAGTIDLVSGIFTPSVQTNLPTSGATGLTASVDGSTWYASSYDGVSVTSLYVGDVTTGNFTLVGPIETGFCIDIAISQSGDLYGHSISTDSLLSIDAGTGLGTVIGPTGLAANFAQGMDFDWSTGELFATIYMGGGVAWFCQMDLNTGAANILVDTTPTNGEFETAIEQGASGTGTAYCFGDGTGTACPCGNTGGAGEGCANGSGSGGVLDGNGGTSVGGSTNLTGANLRPNQPALGFGGLQALNGGNGVIFGDGLRCAGSGVVRLGTRVPDAMGNAEWLDIASIGGYSAGDQRFFQIWYRDPAGSPCGAAFNLTNGYEITFTP